MATTGGQTQRLPRAQKRAVRRTPRVTQAPVTDVQSGGGYKLPRTKPTPAPRTDVQTSGRGYGIPKANKFKRTTTYKQSVGAAKPVRQSDITSSGGDYGLKTARMFHRAATHATGQARQGKPFDPYYLQGAINMGIAPGVTQKGGSFFLKQRMRFLPDQQILIRPKTGAKYRPMSKDEFAVSQAQEMGDPIHAPALKILEKTAVPLHGIAGVASGHTPGYGVRHKTTFGKILKDLGAPAPVAGVGGFVGDVAGDPVTYLTFGAGSLARHAAETTARDVARQVERQAAEAADRVVQTASKIPPNATDAQIEAHARRVSAAAQRVHDDVISQGEARARKAGERAAHGKSTAPGIEAKFAGKEIPGVRRGTAAVGQKLGAAGHAAAQKPVGRQFATVGRTVAGLARDVRPQLRPVDAPEAAHQAGRAASRQARAIVNSALGEAQRYAHGLEQKIGAENYAKVIHALDTKRIGDLEPALREPARFLRDRYRHAERVRKRAGISQGHIGEGQGEVQGYHPRIPESVLESPAGRARTNPKRSTTGTPGSSKGRVASRGQTMAEANIQRTAAGKDPYSTDIPHVFANYEAETAGVAGASHLFRSLAASGRRVKPGTMPHVGPGERVYHLGFASGGRDVRSLGRTKHGGEVVLRGERKATYGLRPVDEAEVANVAKGKGRSGQYVVLHEDTVNRALESATPASATTAFGRLYDKGTGTWKLVATATPGFHARNVVGDTQMAFLGQTARSMPANIAAGVRATKELSRQERAQLGLDRVSSNKTINVGGKVQKLTDFIATARKQGVIRSGYVGREVSDLRRRGGGRLQRWAANREDFIRLSTYKHALDKGMNPSEAARYSLHFHIDYGDLTHFERKVARRAAPFYTFSARSTPIHAKALVQTPGKFAAYQKAREEVGGNNPLKDRGLLEFQQRQAPFLPGKDVFSDALPIAAALNELPAGTDVGAYLSELGQFMVSQANPIGKIPIELIANRNLFLRRDIEDKSRPLVSAPAWVRGLPDNLKRQWGVTENYVDPQTGKKVLGWRGRPDYIARNLTPGPFGFAQTLMTAGANRRGQSTIERVGAFVTGVRKEPYQPESAAMSNLLADRRNVKKQLGSLGQQDIDARDPRYQKLSARQKQIEWQVHQLSVKKGDAVPYFPNAKPPHPADVKVQALEAQATSMRARRPGSKGAASDEFGFMTPEYQRIRDRISVLNKSRGSTRSKSLKRRPDTPAQRAAKRVDKMLERSADPAGAAQERINRMLSRAGG